MVIVPGAPSLTIARFGTVSPGTKLTFDATGCVDPSGYTVRKPLALGLVTVTLSTTESAVPSKGIPVGLPVVMSVVPATLSVRVLSGPSVLQVPPQPVEPSRVSITRAGAPGRNRPALPLPLLV